MQTTPPPSGDPYARATVLHGFRAAVVDVGGDDALRAVADRLPMATRVATIDALVLPFEWVPIAHVIAWHEAIWAGPARGDERELARLVARSIELGFGRFRSAFFVGITPEKLVERSQELWRWQHTHGEVAVSVEAGSGTVVLRDHPYVDHPASRRVTAESYRHIVTMALGEGHDVRVAWGTSTSIPPGPVNGSSGSTGGTRGASQQRPSLVVHLSWRP
jgi:hypothetical protein